MKIEQLTFTRFIAAISIVIFHFGRHVPSLEWGIQFWDVANTFVSFFFCLSGFVLAYVYSQRPIVQWTDFFIARFARLYPLYLTALVLMSIYLFLDNRLTFIDFVLSAALLQAWIPGYSQTVNTPAWAVSVELFFYILFPSILMLFRRFGSTKKLFVAAFLVWITGIGLHVYLLDYQVKYTTSGPLIDFIFYNPLMHFHTFVCGICGGLIYLRNRDYFARVGGVFVLSSLALFMVLTLVPNPVIRYHHNGLAVPIYLVFILGLSSIRDSTIGRMFSRPNFVLLGNLSYSIYILQAPAKQLYAYLIGKSGAAIKEDTVFWLFVVTLVVLSYLAYRVIEEPSRVYIVNRFGVRKKTR